MIHKTGIEIKCNEVQKDIILDAMAKELSIGKVIPFNKTRETLEKQIDWTIKEAAKC